MKQLFGMILLAGVLAGCSEGALKVQPRRPAFDGEIFRMSAKSVEKRNRKDFVVSIRPFSRSPKGAALAADYEATRYCIKYFGTSDILWSVDPLAEGVTLPVRDDVLQISASCDD